MHSTLQFVEWPLLQPPLTSSYPELPVPAPVILLPLLSWLRLCSCCSPLQPPLLGNSFLSSQFQGPFLQEAFLTPHEVTSPLPWSPSCGGVLRVSSPLGVSS